MNRTNDWYQHEKLPFGSKGQQNAITCNELSYNNNKHFYNRPNK